jgi:ABC-type antimicrobial peptide transport system permease subunit
VVGAAAFGLASVGLYGVIAFLTRRRTREIGVRVAIGARKSDIVMLVAGQSSVPVVWGLAIGSLGAIALNQLLRGMLYDVGPADFVNLLVVGALVLGVVALATIRPALAATNVAATVALRDQT